MAYTPPEIIAARRRQVERLHPRLSAQQIGRELGWSAKTILGDFRALRLEPASPGRTRRTRAEVGALEARVVRLYVEEEKPSTAIAREERISKRHVLRILDRHGVERREWPRRLPERPCAREGCENLHRPKASSVAKGHGLYCGDECKNEAQRRHPKPEARLCPVSGAPFTPTGVQVARGGGRFATLEAYWHSDYLAELSSERLSNLHADPERQMEWAKARHPDSTKTAGRRAAEIARLRGTRPGPKSKAEKRRGEIIALWQDGLSEPKIGKRLRLSRLAVQRQLKKARELREI